MNWTPDDDAYLKRNYRDLTDAEMAIAIDRRADEICIRRRELGLGRRWYAKGQNPPPRPDPTPEEIEAAKAVIQSRWTRRERNSRIADDRERASERGESPMPPEFSVVMDKGRWPVYVPV